MCFSAGASFGAAAILGVAGVVTISKAKDKSQLMFAAMPLIFGLQQVSEGFEWLSFNHSAFESCRIPMMYIFLTFAQVVWPSWVPLSFWMMERDKKRKKILMYVSLVGIAGALLLAVRMIYYPITSNIEGHHIRYDITTPHWIIVTSSISYFISTLVAPFSSTFKYTKLLGAVMFTALVITEVFYTHYLISVWCFFASLLSITILLVLQNSLVERSHVHSLLHKRINPEKLEW